MKRKLFYLVIGMGCMLSISAQRLHIQTPNDTLQSVRNLGDGNVAFSIYAPNAKVIGFGGDAMPWGKPVNFSKAPNGVWTAVIPNVKEGVYRYNFTIDGVRVQDPKSPMAVETAALTNIGDGNQFYDMRQNIPHGAVAQRYYYSKTLNTMRRMHIWTPAGYEKSSKKLPVLYLIHGGGDNDASWPGIGCAGNILDNLIADRKMEPMMVVMPNGTIDTPTLEEEVPIFVDDLITDIIPFIESNYNVLTVPSHRAIAGLSMGGMETLEALLKHNQKFDYYWVLSSGWWYDKDIFENYQKQLQLISPELSHVKQLVFTQGGPEDIAYKNCMEMLKLFDNANIKYEFSEQPGGHTWYVWRKDLFNLAQRLFK